MIDKDIILRGAFAPEVKWIKPDPKPKINESAFAKSLLSKMSGNVLERLHEKEETRIEKLKSRQQRKLESELGVCTFQPNVKTKLLWKRRKRIEADTFTADETNTIEDTVTTEESQKYVLDTIEQELKNKNRNTQVSEIEQC